MKLSELAPLLEPFDLRSCLIEQNGRLLFAHYRNELIETELAKVNSCTKSILSALICIAMDQGILPGEHTPISDFFPQLLDDPDPRKRDIRLIDLLTMASGFQWTEFGGHKSFPRMTRSANWVDFVLEQPMSDAPGTRMEYNSGASQLLSAILVQASGMTTARFAEERLFGPLGIDNYKWEIDPQGIHTGGYGLQLRPLDMLKFGRLYLNRGRSGQHQLIPEERVIRSVQPAIAASAPNSGYYGWHWWMDHFEVSADQDQTAASAPTFDYFYARGYGGQFIYVVPSMNIVAVLTDDKRKKDRIPAHVFRDFIAPLLPIHSPFSTNPLKGRSG